MKNGNDYRPCRPFANMEEGKPYWRLDIQPLLAKRLAARRRTAWAGL